MFSTLHENSNVNVLCEKSIFLVLFRNLLVSNRVPSRLSVGIGIPKFWIPIDTSKFGHVRSHSLTLAIPRIHTLTGLVTLAH